ncbi:hypothetical protein ACE1TI_16285 [Alteribacillus sp. JSM 102045]|uniref:hypothetical protein n=1 Tax=Alteribacillus sp. JSM 102045 TaxID=1562101 RepID=UPI0035C14CEB
MSAAHYHNVCNRFRGRAVEIRTRDGRRHRGIIWHVDHSRVFLEPFGRKRDLGGFGYGFFGPGYGFGYGLALGAIVSLALLPFFFW